MSRLTVLKRNAKEKFRQKKGASSGLKGTSELSRICLQSSASRTCCLFIIDYFLLICFIDMFCIMVNTNNIHSFCDMRAPCMSV